MRKTSTLRIEIPIPKHTRQIDQYILKIRILDIELEVLPSEFNKDFLPSNIYRRGRAHF